MMSRWWVGDESKIDDHDASIMSRWWIGDKSVMSWWKSMMCRCGDELVKINYVSVMSRWKSLRRWWLVGDESVKIDDHNASMMSWWLGSEIQWSCCLDDESMIRRWKSMTMMRRWWVGDELVKINDESVISRRKSVMRRWWVGAESVMSPCLFRNSLMSRW